MTQPSRSYAADDRRWCECEHPLDWHDDEGRCQAPLGSSEIELSADCSCEAFVEREEWDRVGKVR